MKVFKKIISKVMIIYDLIRANKGYNWKYSQIGGKKMNF